MTGEPQQGIPSGRTEPDYRIEELMPKDLKSTTTRYGHGSEDVSCRSPARPTSRRLQFPRSQGSDVV